jgi:uncharacterized membrane protein YhiD involved in acid resistance
MKKAFLAALATFLFIPFSTVFGQNGGLLNEQLQTRLDSLYQLEREARQSGEENKYVAEIKQLQTLIKTERERVEEENLKSEVAAPDFAKETNEYAEYIEKITAFFAGNKLLDNLIIAMGVIAILAAIFLIFIRLFLAISPKREKSAVKKKVLPKKANVAKATNRYKEKSAQTPQISENITYSLRNLANQNSVKIKQEIVENIPPKNKEMTKKEQVEGFKNEILRKFDSGKDAASIARDFNVSQDQISMILRLAGRK